MGSCLGSLAGSGFQFFFQVVDIDTTFLELTVSDKISMQRNISFNPVDKYFT